MRLSDSNSVSIVIELRQLRYFAKVAELEHFGRASEELHIVQPALSRQVRQLEEELGVELFERLPRGVKLTPAGVFLSERAGQLLADVDRLISATKLAAKGQRGFLRVGFADGTILSGHVPEIIKRFRNHYPEVELELVPATSVAQAELLTNGTINLGFVYWLPAQQENVKHHEINKENIVLAVPKAHPLASRKTVRLLDLVGYPFVWIKRSNSPMYYDLILSKCNQAGLTLNVVQEGTTETIILSLVEAGIGITFMTESAKYRHSQNVSFIDISDLRAHIVLKAMWKANDRSPALKELLNTITKPQSTK
jgi:DNA-binding transcriptional LysR family regulator